MHSRRQTINEQALVMRKRLAEAIKRGAERNGKEVRVVEEWAERGGWIFPIPIALGAQLLWRCPSDCVRLFAREKKQNHRGNFTWAFVLKNIELSKNELKRDLISSLDCGCHK